MTVTVLLSVLLHGISAAPLTRRLAEAGTPRKRVDASLPGEARAVDDAGRH